MQSNKPKEQEEPPMKIGVPKEIKKLEYRVGLTPMHARHYILAGHEVMIQRGAGIGSGFFDEEYEKVGCQLADDIATIYHENAMIIKVKEPLEEEFLLLQPGQILFTFLHLRRPSR